MSLGNPPRFVEGPVTVAGKRSKKDAGRSRLSRYVIENETGGTEEASSSLSDGEDADEPVGVASATGGTYAPCQPPPAMLPERLALPLVPRVRTTHHLVAKLCNPIRV
jgi:hypothetical protein